MSFSSLLSKGSKNPPVTPTSGPPYGSVASSANALEAPEADETADMEGGGHRPNGNIGLLRKARVCCVNGLKRVYANLSIFSMKAEKSSLSCAYTEVKIKELAAELGSKGFYKASDTILLHVRKDEEISLVIDDSNVATNTFRSLVFMKSTTPGPYGRCVVSRVQHEVQLDVNSLLLNLGAAVLAWFWLGWRWVLTILLCKLCCDLIVSRCDTSHPCAVLAAKEFYSTDTHGNIVIVLAPQKP